MSKPAHRDTLRPEEEFGRPHRRKRRFWPTNKTNRDECLGGGFCRFVSIRVIRRPQFRAFRIPPAAQPPTSASYSAADMSFSASAGLLAVSLKIHPSP